MWKRHCRLSGLSSRCGGAVLVCVRGLCALLRSRIGIVSFSAGRTLGLRAPDCAKESSTLWTLLRGWPSEKMLFTRRAKCVLHGLSDLLIPHSEFRIAHRRRHPGTRVDPPGSNLWPGGSCCIAMLPTRTIVQTRAAPKRRGVGLTRAERSGVQGIIPCLRTRCGRWRIRCSTGRWAPTGRGFSG